MLASGGGITRRPVDALLGILLGLLLVGAYALLRRWTRASGSLDWLDHNVGARAVAVAGGLAFLTVFLAGFWLISK